MARSARRWRTSGSAVAGLPLRFRIVASALKPADGSRHARRRKCRYAEQRRPQAFTDRGPPGSTGEPRAVPNLATREDLHACLRPDPAALRGRGACGPEIRHHQEVGYSVGPDRVQVECLHGSQSGHECNPKRLAVAGIDRPLKRRVLETLDWREDQRVVQGIDVEGDRLDAQVGGEGTAVVLASYQFPYRYDSISAGEVQRLGINFVGNGSWKELQCGLAKPLANRVNRES